jgi:hypothetical protein
MESRQSSYPSLVPVTNAMMVIMTVYAKRRHHQYSSTLYLLTLHVHGRQHKGSQQVDRERYLYFIYNDVTSKTLQKRIECIV